MVAAARYEILLERPTVSWQGAIAIAEPLAEARSLLVTVHGYRPDGSVVEQAGRKWYLSEGLNANFYYLPPAEAGTVITLPPLTHNESVTRIELVVRPLGTPATPAPATVSTLCFQDLDPIDGTGPTVISAHAMEVVDV